MLTDHQSIIAENLRRRQKFLEPYDPISGVGSPIPRFQLRFSSSGVEYDWWLPVIMKKDNLELLHQLGELEKLIESMGFIPDESTCAGFIKGLIDDRIAHDFEYWGAVAAKVINKKGMPVPFILNPPQRKIHKIIEEDRINNKQGLYNLLKCRQFGGSTYVDYYYSFLLLHCLNNAQCAIVAEVEAQAGIAAQMFDNIIEYYPPELGEIRLLPIAKQSKHRKIVFKRNINGHEVNRDCGVLAIGSVERPNSLRGRPWRLLHATEVGVWGESSKKSAESLNQAVTSGMPINSDMYIIHIRESTAKGLNYWYKEWQKSEQGKSKYKNIFIGTLEDPQYQISISDYPSFIDAINRMEEQDREYAYAMWEAGATLEAIHFWFDTRLTLGYEHEKMLEEYPNFPTDAFQSSGRRVFPIRYVQNIRATCCNPTWTGDITADTNSGKDAFTNISFSKYPKGEFMVWSLPDTSVKVSNRYVVSVDIGGRWEGADYSVIRVFDRIGMIDGGLIEVVATWRGHLDSDLVAWKAAQIAFWYNNALLVVERNSLDSLDEENPGDSYLTVLNEIIDWYENIYTGMTPDKIRQGVPVTYGFHTNKSTRPMVISTLIKCARTQGYIERYEQVAYEMDRFVTKPNGKMEHQDGEKDDCILSTGIGLYVAIEKMEPPQIVEEKKIPLHPKNIVHTESTFTL